MTSQDASFASEVIMEFLKMGVCPYGYDRKDLRAFAERLEALQAEAPPAPQGWQPIELVQRLVEAIDHLETCGACGEDSLTACDRGRLALAARMDARIWLSTLPPPPTGEKA